MCCRRQWTWDSFRRPGDNAIKACMHEITNLFSLLVHPNTSFTLSSAIIIPLCPPWPQWAFTKIFSFSSVASSGIHTRSFCRHIPLSAFSASFSGLYKFWARIMSSHSTCGVSIVLGIRYTYRAAIFSELDSSVFYPFAHLVNMLVQTFLFPSTCPISRSNCDKWIAHRCSLDNKWRGEFGRSASGANTNSRFRGLCAHVLAVVPKECNPFCQRCIRLHMPLFCRLSNSFARYWSVPPPRTPWAHDIGAPLLCHIVQVGFVWWHLHKVFLMHL